jgi:hypothetical protein
MKRGLGGLGLGGPGVERNIRGEKSGEWWCWHLVGLWLFWVFLVVWLFGFWLFW